MSSSPDDDQDGSGRMLDCWDWPVWCIVLMAIAGVLLLAGIVLTGLNGHLYRKMKRVGMHVGHNTPPSRAPLASVARTRKHIAVRPRAKPAKK